MHPKKGNYFIFGYIIHLIQFYTIPEQSPMKVLTSSKTCFLQKFMLLFFRYGYTKLETPVPARTLKLNLGHGQHLDGGWTWILKQPILSNTRSGECLHYMLLGLLVPEIVLSRRVVLFISVSDPDPDWIRIRIQGLNPDPG